MASFSPDDLIGQIRQYIADEKIININAVDESPAIVLDNTVANWGANLYISTATGREGEIFATQNMPLVSGSTVKLKGGRWNYHNGGDYVWPYDSVSAIRQFQISYYDGLFIIPSGAVAIASGEKVSLTYTWEENQEYRFSDTEIKNWVPEGFSYIRERGYSPPYAVSGRGDSLDFIPYPSGIDATLLSLSTSYMMRRAIFESEISEGISVRDGDTAFDTTKKLVHRGKSLEEVKKDLNAIIDDVVIGNLNSAGVRIDTYSTKDNDPTGIGGDQEIIYTRSTGSTGPVDVV